MQPLLSSVAAALEVPMRTERTSDGQEQPTCGYFQDLAQVLVETGRATAYDNFEYEGEAKETPVFAGLQDFLNQALANTASGEGENSTWRPDDWLLYRYALGSGDPASAERAFYEKLVPLFAAVPPAQLLRWLASGGRAEEEEEDEEEEEAPGTAREALASLAAQRGLLFRWLASSPFIKAESKEGLRLAAQDSEATVWRLDEFPLSAQNGDFQPSAQYSQSLPGLLGLLGLGDDAGEAGSSERALLNLRWFGHFFRWLQVRDVELELDTPVLAEGGDLGRRMLDAALKADALAATGAWALPSARSSGAVVRSLRYNGEEEQEEDEADDTGSPLVTLVADLMTGAPSMALPTRGKAPQRAAGDTAATRTVSQARFLSVADAIVLATDDPVIASVDVMAAYRWHQLVPLQLLARELPLYASFVRARREAKLRQSASPPQLPEPVRLAYERYLFGVLGATSGPSARRREGDIGRAYDGVLRSRLADRPTLTQDPLARSEVAQLVLYVGGSGVEAIDAGGAGEDAGDRSGAGSYAVHRHLQRIVLCASAMADWGLRGQLWLADTAVRALTERRGVLALAQPELSDRALLVLPAVHPYVLGVSPRWAPLLSLLFARPRTLGLYLANNVWFSPQRGRDFVAAAPYWESYALSLGQRVHTCANQLAVRIRAQMRRDAATQKAVDNVERRYLNTAGLEYSATSAAYALVLQAAQPTRGRQPVSELEAVVEQMCESRRPVGVLARLQTGSSEPPVGPPNAFFEQWAAAVPNLSYDDSLPRM